MLLRDWLSDHEMKFGEFAALLGVPFECLSMDPEISPPDVTSSSLYRMQFVV